MVELPEISFTVGKPEDIHFQVDGNILRSLLDFNSRELNKEVAVDPIQKYYYVDNDGALTFVEGACINEFKIESAPFKVLFNERLVQLFKLFTDQKVDVTIIKTEIGKDIEDSPLYQNKIQFLIPGIQLTAILPDSDLVDKYPSMEIRSLANVNYPGCVTVSKTLLLEALDRLSIFDKKAGGNKVDLKKCGQLNFGTSEIEIINMKDKNLEKFAYSNGSVSPVEFTSFISLSDLVKHGNISLTDNITIYFGTGDAIMMQRKNLKQVIPELGDPSEYLSNLGE